LPLSGIHIICHLEGQSPAAISSLSLPDLGCLDKKKKEDKKEGVHEEENIKEDFRNSEEGEQK